MTLDRFALLFLLFRHDCSAAVLFMLLQIVLNAVQQDKQPLGSEKEQKKCDDKVLICFLVFKPLK